MKLLIIKGEVHFIETDNKEEFHLITDKDVTTHDGDLYHLLKAKGGAFDDMTAYANTQEIFDNYNKRKE